MGQKSTEGVVIEVHVVPKASVTEIVGWEGEVLKVRVAAQPEKDKANRELIRFLAKKCGVAKSAVTLVAGDKSRMKRLHFEGLSKEALVAKLGP